MDSKKFHAKKVDSFRMRAIGRTVWAGLYQTEFLKYPINNDDCKYPQLKLQGDEVLSNLI